MVNKDQANAYLSQPFNGNGDVSEVLSNGIQNNLGSISIRIW